MSRIHLILIFHETDFEQIYLGTDYLRSPFQVQQFFFVESICVTRELEILFRPCFVIAFMFFILAINENFQLKLTTNF